MKTEYIEIEKEQLEFPVIMRNTASSLIVLFTSETKGVVLRESLNSCTKIGHSADEWESVNNRNVWAVYNGTVTLSND